MCDIYIEELGLNYVLGLHDVKAEDRVNIVTGILERDIELLQNSF